MLGRLIRQMEEEQFGSDGKKSSEPRLMTVRDAATVLNCSQHQVYRYISRGLFRECLVKLGDVRTVRFHPTKFLRCIETGGFAGENNTT